MFSILFFWLIFEALNDGLGIGDNLTENENKNDQFDDDLDDVIDDFHCTFIYYYIANLITLFYSAQSVYMKALTVAPCGMYCIS